ncbi:hypothetical protein RchiOBHm_Chr3g0491501 [Rosa chinensis]|uniref:Transmembrane protein n=1 Tax=Rosa chinensis TaxID=74649 RepID=A0A2P6RGA8_ROSCH|nr:hypothetical protein RchiOBHm_Chr3g0491501 [Rosa chinensis]
MSLYICLYIRVYIAPNNHVRVKETIDLDSGFDLRLDRGMVLADVFESVAAMGRLKDDGLLLGAVTGLAALLQVVLLLMASLRLVCLLVKATSMLGLVASKKDLWLVVLGGRTVVTAGGGVALGSLVLDLGPALLLGLVMWIWALGIVSVFGSILA